MQFKVPQDVQREDHIVGPLTFKQLIICGVGGIIAYTIYIALAKTYLWITWFPPIALVTMVTLAFAFVRPLDLSFSKWIARWIEFSLLPRKRIWIKSSAEFYSSLDSTNANQTKQHKATEDKNEAILDKQKKMEELSKFLDSQKQNK
jgi:hypothetical protein